MILILKCCERKSFAENTAEIVLYRVPIGCTAAPLQLDRTAPRQRLKDAVAMYSSPFFPTIIITLQSTNLKLVLYSWRTTQFQRLERELLAIQNKRANEEQKYKRDHTTEADAASISIGACTNAGSNRPEREQGSLVSTAIPTADI